MKKLLVLLLVLLSTVVYAADRHSDRDWDITTLPVLSTATRVTNGQSGMLKIWVGAADVYIAFNATANVNSLYLPQKTNYDFYPASVKVGEWFTVYSASNTTINYVILD